MQEDLQKCVLPCSTNYGFITRLIVCERFGAQKDRNEMWSNGLLFPPGITYLAKVRATQTGRRTRSRPRPLNSRTGVYIEQSQLPVKCYVRLGTSRYEA